jgi:hypothetical protein
MENTRSSVFSKSGWKGCLYSIAVSLATVIRASISKEGKSGNSFKTSSSKASVSSKGLYAVAE